MPDPLRIVVVAPILCRYDAISTAALNTWRLLKELPGIQVSILTTHSEFEGVPATTVPGLAELLRAPAFLAADLIIYHFGLHNPVFDALLVGNGRARQVVRFHNVTPAEFLRSEDAPLIRQSFRQMQNFRHADLIWADSLTNAVTLREHGIEAPQVEVIPLVVGTPAPAEFRRKRAERVELLYVGRIVPSKGTLDLVRALDQVRRQGGVPFRLRLAGNLAFSDPAYRHEVEAAVARLEGAAEFLGTVDDAALERLYHEAHILGIPSYHEGFCKPVVEALRAGCIPVGYAAANLPHVVAGLGRLVPPGSVAALAAALAELVEDVAAAVGGDGGAQLRLDAGRLDPAGFDARAAAHVAAFGAERIARQTARSIARLFPGRGIDRKLNRMHAIQPPVEVLPDDEMRELDRTSLNRLPDLGDWEPGGELSEIMGRLRQPVTIHRKSWEYALAIKGLTDLGAVRPEARALAVGAGSESPLYHFANTVAEMVATDLYDNPQHEGTPAMLADPRAFAPFPYREDHLKVLRMPGDRLDFPEASFDFVFCLSSIEHFGSRDTQRRAFDEMARVVKPGGIVCVITELILTGHSHAEYFRWDEIESLFLRHPVLRPVGGEPDFRISESLVAFPVDIARSRRIPRSPHVVLRQGDMLWTSFSLFFTRPGPAGGGAAAGGAAPAG